MCLMPYANNKCADRPAHLRSLISTFVVRCLDCILAISEVSRFQLASVAEHDGLNITWSKIPEYTFSRDEAHMKLVSKYVEIFTNVIHVYCRTEGKFQRTIKQCSSWSTLSCLYLSIVFNRNS